MRIRVPRLPAVSTPLTPAASRPAARQRPRPTVPTAPTVPTVPATPKPMPCAARWPRFCPRTNPLRWVSLLRRRGVRRSNCVLGARARGRTRAEQLEAALEAANLVLARALCWLIRDEAKCKGLRTSCMSRRSQGRAGSAASEVLRSCDGASGRRRPRAAMAAPRACAAVQRVGESLGVGHRWRRLRSQLPTASWSASSCVLAVHAALADPHARFRLKYCLGLGLVLGFNP